MEINQSLLVNSSLFWISIFLCSFRARIRASYDSLFAFIAAMAGWGRSIPAVLRAAKSPRGVPSRKSPLSSSRQLSTSARRRAISDAAWRSVGCAALWRPSFRGAASLLLHCSPPARLLHRVGGELEVTRPCEGHGEATRLRRGEEQLSEQVPDRRARGGVGKIGKSRHEELFRFGG